MTDKIEIGAVAKPQGIKGEIKIRLFCDGFQSVKNIKTVEISEKEYVVEYIKRISDEEGILKLVGIDDRNFVEGIRQKEVYAKREEIAVEDGSYFITDVIGCTVYLSSGKEMGKIYDIVSGNVDYYYIETAEGKAVFPLIKELKAEFDLDKRTVTVDAKIFTGVVMYEN